MPFNDEYAKRHAGLTKFIGSDVGASMLYVFEGPDSVGKSTVSSHFAEHLRRSSQVPVRHWSFPGRDAGTLGWAVYRLHHDPATLGVQSMTPASLQLLHIAAHVDAIEAKILPALRAGEHVVLDRFWWSTWVYGVVRGASRGALQVMIDVERKVWDAVVPTAVFLIERAAPFALREGEQLAGWHCLREEYARLAQRESSIHPVVHVSNTGRLEEAVRDVTRVFSPRPR